MAFPCNDFGAQEPKSNAEILDFARSKGATFPVLGKIACERGEETHPLYTFLKTPFSEESLKWNFKKYLCDANGEPIRSYTAKQDPLSFEEELVELLK